MFGRPKKSKVDLMDRQLKTISIIFSVISILYLFTGYFSINRYEQMSAELQKSIDESERKINQYETRLSNLENRISDKLFESYGMIDGKIRNESLDIRSNVKENIIEMQKKIEAAAGNLLKEAKIEVRLNDGPLEGKSIGYHSLHMISIKNVGEKRINGLSVNLYSSFMGGELSVSSNRKGFSTCIPIKYPEVQIDPGDSYYLFRGQVPFHVPEGVEPKGNCLMDIFFGESKYYSVEFYVPSY